MRTTLAKLSLLTLLITASIGTASALDTSPLCPTVTGTISSAQSQQNGGWAVFRINPLDAGHSSSIWQGLIIMIKDSDVTNEDEAKARGKEILDSAWWGSAQAAKVDLENGNYYYRCRYEVATPFRERGDGIALVTFDLNDNGGGVNESPSARNDLTMTNSSPLSSLLNKANHEKN